MLADPGFAPRTQGSAESAKGTVEDPGFTPRTQESAESAKGTVKTLLDEELLVEVLVTSAAGPGFTPRTQGSAEPAGDSQASC